MLIIGAKGFAKEVIDILINNQDNLDNLVFYDDVNSFNSPFLFEKYPILDSIEKAESYFNEVDNRFAIGIGNPQLRKRMYDKFKSIGGVLVSTISNKSIISTVETNVDLGCNVLHGAIISSSVNIGFGCIIYFNTVITHDCSLGDFVEISPSVNILGRCKIGSYTQIGSNSVILPDLLIGENVIIGAGSVVTKDVPDNSLVYGSPAKFIKQITPII